VAFSIGGAVATDRPPLVPEDVLELALPDGVIGYELVDGVPVPVSPASLRDGRIMGEVYRALANHIETHGTGGEVYVDGGFVLGLHRDPRRMRGPDVAFVSGQKLREHGPAGFGFGHYAPDLAVEVELSSGRKPGGLQRVRDYLDGGVTLVWTIHVQRRAATVYRQGGSTIELGAADSLDGEDVVPGFRLPLAKLLD
jgi:Uma2 family endonuclease